MIKLIRYIKTINSDKMIFAFHARVGNKRAVKKFTVRIGPKNYHYCPECSYFLAACLGQCRQIERMAGLNEICIGRFNVFDYSISPIKVERVHGIFKG